MSELPRIVRFLATDDSSGASCPHCGATGRYILNFVVEDGRTLGAMRGCVKLFPVSKIAVEELRLRTKQAQRAKIGWELNAADRGALDAIAEFYAGTVGEQYALNVIQYAKSKNIQALAKRRVGRS